VLITAAAAASEVRALGFDTLRRRFQHLLQFRFGELFFLARDARRDAFALDSEGNENRFAV
jgi:hypothetical protein